jgi:hypothetical protein|mmetsp:Transcript_6040/g.25660  ORF Transcript_6040/g.25660 Transcript_6040/m.25660 type:complete len:89 (+) Transcript_6040:1-267(+)
MVWLANGGFVDPIRADAERRARRDADARFGNRAGVDDDAAEARRNRRRNRWMRLLASLFGPRRVRHRGGPHERARVVGWGYRPPRRRT